jgi:predicted  nucleic acid-binding Zn-ribbon protein
MLLCQISLALPSCNKHNILDQERQKLDAERERIMQEAAALDVKIQSMPNAYNLNTLQRQVEALEKKATALEAEAAAKMKKWEAIFFKSGSTILRS